MLNYDELRPNILALPSSNLIFCMKLTLVTQSELQSAPHNGNATALHI
jgi:hypothetical protein